MDPFDSKCCRKLLLYHRKSWAYVEDVMSWCKSPFERLFEPHFCLRISFTLWKPAEWGKCQASTHIVKVRNTFLCVWRGQYLSFRAATSNYFNYNFIFSIYLLVVWTIRSQKMVENVKLTSSNVLYNHFMIIDHLGSWNQRIKIVGY